MTKISTKYSLAGVVSVLTFLVYLPALQNKFVEWDDSRFIYDNPFIRSLNGTFFRWAFLDFSAPGSDYWRPLSYLSHAFDYAIWQLNPLGHHLTNNIIHTVNTFLVVMLTAKLLSILQKKKPSDSQRVSYTEASVNSSREIDTTEMFDTRTRLIAAGTAGLLFGLHPIHVESVAWISERKDLLCATFFLMSIILYLSYATYGRCSGYLLSLGMFICALLSKPMAVSLPVILLILDWYPLERISSLKTLSRAMVEKIPFFVLSLALSAITILAQKEVGAIEMHRPFSDRLLVAVKSLVTYVWKMVYPADLNPYYPYPATTSLISLEYFPAVVIVSVLSALCLLFIRRHKALPVLWAYYVITLLPVIGIVQVGGQAMADRYTYLPSISPFLLAGVSLGLLYRHLRRRRLLVPCAIAASLMVVSGMSYITVTQIGVWRDGISLWNHVIKREPERVPVAYNNRGIALLTEGHIEEAIDDFNRAILLNPYNAEAYGNRATAFDIMGELDQALADRDKAVSLSASSTTYHARGAILEKKGEFDKALADYRKAAALDTSYIDAYIAQGVLYRKTGSLDEAIASLLEALKVNADSDYAHYQLGKVLSDAERLDEALEHFVTAVRLSPDNAYYRNVLGITYGQKGHFNKAVEQFETAVRLAPEEQAYRNNLNRALNLRDGKESS